MPSNTGDAKLPLRTHDNVRATVKKCVLLVNMATILPIIFIVGYASIGASQQMLAWVNQFLTPLVDSLHFIGLGIIKPPMDGPMPVRFYLNLTGLAIWGAFVCNLATITYLVCNRRLYALKFLFETARQHAIESYGWSPNRATYTLQGGAYFLFLPFAVFWTLALLNGSHGWFVFHVKGLVVAWETTLVFVFPGAFVTICVFLVVNYISYDLSRLFSLFSRKQK